MEDPWDTSGPATSEVVIDRKIQVVTDHEALPEGAVGVRIESSTKVDGEEVSVDVLNMDMPARQAEDLASALYTAAWLTASN